MIDLCISFQRLLQQITTQLVTKNKWWLGMCVYLHDRDKNFESEEDNGINLLLSP